MSTPVVSVIMPAYNHEKYVGEAVESVLSQTFKNFEFIIINDGSTDKTEKIIKKFHDNRIKYYFQKNKGAHESLNIGISKASGKYLSIINSDDLYHPYRLEYLLNTADLKKAKFIITDLKYIDRNSKEIKNAENKFRYFTTKSTYLTTKSLEAAALFGNIAVTTSNFFFHSSAKNQVGLFKPYRYTHDYDYLLRALLRYKSKFLYLDNQQLLFYRIHNTNTINESRIGRESETFTLLINKLPSFISNNNDRTKIESTLNFLQAINDNLNNEIIKRDNKIDELINSLTWLNSDPLRSFILKLLDLKQIIRTKIRPTNK